MKWGRQFDIVCHELTCVTALHASSALTLFAITGFCMARLILIRLFIRMPHVLLGAASLNDSCKKVVVPDTVGDQVLAWFIF